MVYHCHVKIHDESAVVLEVTGPFRATKLSTLLLGYG